MTAPRRLGGAAPASATPTLRPRWPSSSVTARKGADRVTARHARPEQRTVRVGPVSSAGTSLPAAARASFAEAGDVTCSVLEVTHGSAASAARKLIHSPLSRDPPVRQRREPRGGRVKGVSRAADSRNEALYASEHGSSQSTKWIPRERRVDHFLAGANKRAGLHERLRGRAVLEPLLEQAPLARSKLLPTPSRDMKTKRVSRGALSCLSTFSVAGRACGS